MEKVYILTDKETLTFEEGMLFRVIKKTGDGLVSYSGHKQAHVEMSKVFSVPAYQKLQNEIKEAVAEGTGVYISEGTNKPLVVIGFPRESWRADEVERFIVNNYKEKLLTINLSVNDLLKEVATYQLSGEPNKEDCEDYNINPNHYNMIKSISDIAEVMDYDYSECAPTKFFNDFGYRFWLGYEI